MNTKKRSNREGTIYYVEKQQRWRAEITWFDNAGNKRKKSWTSQKKSEVKESLDKFKKQLLINGTEFTVENRTFRQFSEEWLRVAVKPKIKPTSYDRKIITLENQVYKYIGGVRIDKLTHSQIQNMINALSDSGLSYSTVKKAYEAVSGCMRYYRIKTLTSYNPCEGINAGD